MAKKQPASKLWGDISENDFLDESNIVDEDIGEFNKDAMTIFGANINYARQIVNIIDSLKPVERRIMYALYKDGALPGKKTKCASLVTTAMKYHNHGNITVYGTMVGMTQEWKTPVPYIAGPSNFGSANSSDTYSADRYSEAYLSKYGYECFFSDFSPSAVGMVSFVTGLEEPKFLPSKFPNILVNGTDGIGWGHQATIAPYHIADIINLCKTYLKNPEADDIIIYPDLPTGCYVVDEPEIINNICKYGKGTLRMRAWIDIEETDTEWHLIITHIPYTVDFLKTYKKIIGLAKMKKFTFKHVGEESTSYVNADGSTYVDPKMVIKLDKALDPYKVREALYRMTDLDKTLSINIKSMVDETTIETTSLKQLVLTWLSHRRLYKRSLYNHTLNKLRSDIDTKDILIELTEADNLDRTVAVIRKTKLVDLPEALMRDYGMSSHQAKVISTMALSAFTADAHDKYVEDRKKLQEKFDATFEIAYNSKKIDKVILDELEDLRKYGTAERRSPIVKVDDGIVVTNSEHLIAYTIQGNIKKVPKVPDKYHTKNPIGALATGDQPKGRVYVNNLDSLFLMDSFGRFTIMPVHEIPNTVYTSTGESIYNVTKLEGDIKSTLAIGNVSNQSEPAAAENAMMCDYSDVMLATLTENGMLKATCYEDYVYSTTAEGTQIVARRFNQRGMKIADGDKLADTAFLIATPKQDSKVLVYTAKGEYILSNMSEVPVTATRDAYGLRFIVPAEDDKCVGIKQLVDDKYIVIVTARGYVKKIECEFLHEARKRKESSYLIRVDVSDEVIYAQGCNDDESLYVITKTNGETAYPIADIPTLSRMAKGKKIVPVPNGDVIINACVDITK